MDIAIRIMVGVLCVPLLALGVRSMFKPSTMLTDLAVEAKGAAGLNTIRGVMGGVFLGSAAMLVLGLVLENTVWFLAVAVLMGIAAIGRIVGILMDGFDKAVVRPLVVELVIVAVVLVAHLRLGGMCCISQSFVTAIRFCT